MALATLQLRVEVPFKGTTVGEAENEEMVGVEEEPLVSGIAISLKVEAPCGLIAT